jgi:hypothetical protein
MNTKVPGDSKEVGQLSAFHLKEYELLKQEIASAVQESRTLERYALIATAAVWSWLVTMGDNVPGVLWWIPTLLVAFAAFRSLALHVAVNRLGRYIRDEVESQTCDGQPCGWEHFISWPPAASAASLANARRHTSRRSIVLSTSALFWVALGIVSVAVPVLIK